MKGKWIFIVFTCIMLPAISFSQDVDGPLDKIIAFPNKFLSDINKKTTSLENQLTSVSTSYLKKLLKQDNKFKKHLAKIDSISAARLFPAGIATQYSLFIKKIKSESISQKIRSSGLYYPNTDSLQMTLNFLKSNPQLLEKYNISPVQLESALNKLNILQGKLNYSNQINQFVAQRKQQFQRILSKYTNIPNKINSTLANYQMQAASYTNQLKAYKERLNDPDKVVSMALILLYKVPSFNNFVKSNSFLSGMFPGTANIDPNSATQGIQTRKQVESMLVEKMGTQGLAGISKIQSSIQSAQGMVDGLRDRLNASGSGDLNNPDFQVNDQRSKSLFRRIEYGANLQTSTNSYYFPISTDVAFSAAYRINKDNVAGIGLAYIIGWGSDIHHIQISSRGIGLRSFVDLKIQKTFFLSGGFEYNYQQPFNPFHVFDNSLNDWTKSGLIGISKIVNLKSKLVKKSKVQLLWDFLSYYQIPRTQPFIFRVGYSL